jgi:hypothetical protein
MKKRRRVADVKSKHRGRVELNVGNGFSLSYKYEYFFSLVKFQLFCHLSPLSVHKSAGLWLWLGGN